MFSSKESSDLPWHPGQSVTVTPIVIDGKTGSIVTRVITQHNKPNPILVSFRANDQNPDPAQWVEWLRIPSLGPWHYARRDHIEHARRVLTRLRAPSTECSFEGCGRHLEAKGLCKAHYEQVRRGESLRVLNPRRAATVPSAEWFWAQTTRRGECLEWARSVNSQGYAQVSVQGQPVKAHRLAYTFAGGVIPDGAYIDHICRNRRCVEPTHLRPATAKQNAENTKLRSDNTSGFRGVSWNTRNGKWSVRVTHLGRQISGGHFSELEDAARRASEIRSELYTHYEEPTP